MGTAQTAGYPPSLNAASFAGVATEAESEGRSKTLPYAVTVVMILTACVPQTQQHSYVPRLSDIDPCGAYDLTLKGFGLSDENLQDLSERCAEHQRIAADTAYVRQANATAQYIADQSTVLAEQEHAQAVATAEQMNTQAEREMHAPAFIAPELVRDLQQHARSPERLRIALLPISCGTATPPDVCTVAYDRLETALSAKPDVVLVERRHLAAILREQELQLTDFVDADTAVEFGRLLGASHLIALSVAHAAMDENLYDLTARGLSVRTARVAVVHARYRP